MSSEAEKFDKMVREIIAPVFPVIAGQFLEQSGILKGVCLDIGCGNGYLGLEIADQSELDVYLMDCDMEMLKVAKSNLIERKLESKVKLLQADVHEIPLESESVELVVSRGSVFFWEDQPKAFSEIYRILTPGGMAFIGGGFGNTKLKAQIDIEMEKHNPNWPEHLREKIGPDAPPKLSSVLSEAGITDFKIDYSPVGMWAVVQKKA